MSIIPAISPCWCPVNSTLSQQGRGSLFRQKSHHLLAKPKSAPPLRPRRPPAALGAPPAGPARSQDLHGRRCWGGWPREADEREMIFIGRQDLDISVEAFSFSLAPRQSDDGRGMRSHDRGPANDSRAGCDHFAAVHMSAFGTKRTSQVTQSMSASGGKADIV